MKDCVVLMRYPDSQWGTDIVRFSVPAYWRDHQVLEELSYQRSLLHSDDYESLQDMADALYRSTAAALCGTWESVAQAGYFDIEADDNYIEDEGDDSDGEALC